MAKIGRTLVCTIATAGPCTYVRVRLCNIAYFLINTLKIGAHKKARDIKMADIAFYHTTESPFPIQSVINILPENRSVSGLYC